LEQIGEYTAREWGLLRKRQYLDQLKTVFAGFRDTPGLGAARDEIGQGLRAHPVGLHVVFYRNSNDAVIIVRVLHQRMDPAHQFKPDSEI